MSREKQARSLSELGIDPKLYPFESRVFELSSGHEMHYIDEGKSDTAIVMVHGNPTWSFFYRNVVISMREKFRCIAVDHIGCGLSSKPQEYAYRLEQHIANLEELLASLNVNKVLLVLHDWGGAIGMGWARRHVDKVKGVAFMNTAAYRSTRIPLRIWVCGLPFIGPFLVRGFNAFAGAAKAMAVARSRPLKSNIGHGYVAPYSNWNDRIATLRFVQDIPLSASHPSYSELEKIEKSLQEIRELPVFLLWGARDFCFTTHFFQRFREFFPDAQTRLIEDAGHYVLEDAPESVGFLQEFLNGVQC